MDAYASVGMPVIYRHWSYGKQFISTEKNYRRGHMGLAYEIVINSDPCIAYLMEENTMAMQALVIAHAATATTASSRATTCSACGPTPSSIIDYLVYARNYISRVRGAPRHRRGRRPARLLPCADELRRRPLPPPAEAFAGRGSSAPRRSARHYLQQQVNDLWRTLPRKRADKQREEDSAALSRRAAGEPAVLHREERAAAGALAARGGAHRAQDRAVLLSAAPDPGDERGLGHVLALHAAQHAVRRRPAGRRLHDRVAAVAHQRGLPAAGRPPRATAASTRTRWASRCSRDLRRICEKPTEEDRALVPRHRRHRLAARRSTTRCATSRTRASSASTCRPS